MIRRIRQSLENRGVKGTIQSALSILEDFFFDFRSGTDTLRRVALDDLSVVGHSKEGANPYHPTRGRAFRKVMNKFPFSAGSVFVDFGSGKGKLLMLASQLGFKRVVGIEFSPELCAIAETNLSAWTRKHGEFGFEILCQDAGNYVLKGDENVFFMFNPFGAAVMERVVNNISASLKRHPRNAWLIYGDPRKRAVIERQIVVREIMSYSYGGFDFVVWSMGEDRHLRS